MKAWEHRALLRPPRCGEAVRGGGDGSGRPLSGEPPHRSEGVMHACGEPRLEEQRALYTSGDGCGTWRAGEPAAEGLRHWLKLGGCGYSWYPSAPRGLLPLTPSRLREEEDEAEDEE